MSAASFDLRLALEVADQDVDRERHQLERRRRCVIRLSPRRHERSCRRWRTAAARSTRRRGSCRALEEARPTSGAPAAEAASTSSLKNTAKRSSTQHLAEDPLGRPRSSARTAMTSTAVTPRRERPRVTISGRMPRAAAAEHAREQQRRSRRPPGRSRARAARSLAERHALLPGCLAAARRAALRSPSLAPAAAVVHAAWRRPPRPCSDAVDRRLHHAEERLRVEADPEAARTMSGTRVHCSRQVEVREPLVLRRWSSSPKNTRWYSHSM